MGCVEVGFSVSPRSGIELSVNAWTAVPFIRPCFRHVGVEERNVNGVRPGEMALGMVKEVSLMLLPHMLFRWARWGTRMLQGNHR